MVAVQAKALLDFSQPPDMRKDTLELLARDLRPHLKRGDAVLVIEPSWVVVFGVMDETGIAAVVKRLRENVSTGDRLLFGAAQYPQDGEAAADIFKQATTRLDQGLTRPKSPHGVKVRSSGKG